MKTNAEHIFQEFGPALSRVAASYAPAGAEREDLLQDIALGIVMALPKFREECSLRTFVYRIAHNRGLDHAWKRKQKRERGVDTPATGDQATDKVHCRELSPEQATDNRKKLEQFTLKEYKKVWLLMFSLVLFKEMLLKYKMYLCVVASLYLSFGYVSTTTSPISSKMAFISSLT